MRILQVKRFNNYMLLEKKYTMIMTLGNGSMVDEPRKNGYVLCGDDWAKWFPNEQQSLIEYGIQ